MSGDSYLEPTPATLRIRFGQGERPHLFWVGADASRKLRIKVLSKRTRDGRLVMRVLEESGRARRLLVDRELERSTPSGWIEHWVDRLGHELGVTLRCYDLRHVETPEQWTAVAHALGWTR